MSDHEHLRQPGLFVWTAYNRGAYVLIGRMSVSVSARGSEALGTKTWAVREVFGSHFCGSKNHVCLDDAILDAEQAALRLAHGLLPEMRKVAVVALPTDVPTPAQIDALVYFARRERYGASHRFVVRDLAPRRDVEERCRASGWIDGQNRLTDSGKALVPKGAGA